MRGFLELLVVLYAVVRAQFKRGPASRLDPHHPSADRLDPKTAMPRTDSFPGNRRRWV